MDVAMLRLRGGAVGQDAPLSLNRYAKSRDVNEPQIREALERAGYSVEGTDTPCDLLAGKHGQSHLVEVKAPPGPKGGTSSGKLTPAQRKFLARWKGCHHIVRTPEDAISDLNACNEQLRRRLLG